MKRNALQEANHNRHVCALIRKHGLSGAKRELGENSPCLKTLRDRAVAAGISIPGRGRPNVYDKVQIVKLIDKFKEHSAPYKEVQKYLAAKNLPCPTHPMLVRWAHEAGIVIKRGRPVVKAA